RRAAGPRDPAGLRAAPRCGGLRQGARAGAERAGDPPRAGALVPDARHPGTRPAGPVRAGGRGQRGTPPDGGLMAEAAVSVATATCPACGAPVGTDATFCEACGHELSTP